MKIISGRMRAFTQFLLILTLNGYMVCEVSASIAHVMSIEEMKEKADVILVGSVESIVHFPAHPDDVPKMHRKVTINVEYFLKNPLNCSEVTVLLLGATIGNTSMLVTDQPEFNVSDRVLLFLIDDVWFLEENPHGYFHLVSEIQGKIEITADTDLGVFGFNATDVDERVSNPSSDDGGENDMEPVGMQIENTEQPWHPLVAPLTMASLLALMYWRRVIPR